ncbi:hypothetical protein ARMSODRAFT_980593 [Armillaria solidipes]|uniref:Uncharacterized protein n=1 Tax=Armillaria solidipes TaxID=1076256 RepID=A0A2H3BD72_9AGAR|nr:hypothetical protein ARMSODRAFT_980593 [Armillaria solidipes]
MGMNLENSPRDSAAAGDTPRVIFEMNGSTCIICCTSFSLARHQLYSLSEHIANGGGVILSVSIRGGFSERLRTITGTENCRRPRRKTVPACIADVPIAECSAYPRQSLDTELLVIETCKGNELPTPESSKIESVFVAIQYCGNAYSIQVTQVRKHPDSPRSKDVARINATLVKVECIWDHAWI